MIGGSIPAFSPLLVHAIATHFSFASAVFSQFYLPKTSPVLEIRLNFPLSLLDSVDHIYRLTVKIDSFMIYPPLSNAFENCPLIMSELVVIATSGQLLASDFLLPARDV